MQLRSLSARHGSGWHLRATPARFTVNNSNRPSSRDTHGAAFAYSAFRFGQSETNTGSLPDPRNVSVNSNSCRPNPKVQEAPHDGDQSTSMDELNICTKDGQFYHIKITAETTKKRDIRAAVANALNTSVELVRLAYRGHELLIADDNAVFRKTSGDDVMHAMLRSTQAEPPVPKQEKLKVYTMEGKVHHITFTPGVTRTAEVRKAVAAVIGAESSETRLQYAGKTLDPSDDATVIQLKPGNLVLHAMKRLAGGSSSNNSNNTLTGNTTSSRRRRRYVTATTPVAQSPKAVKTEVPASPPGLVLTPIQGPSATTEGLACAEARSAFEALSSPTVDVSPSETAPGAGRGSAAVQLAKQFRDLMKHPIPGVSAAPVDDDPLLWHIQLAGPDGTPYAGGWFHVELEFTDYFPGEPPKARFRTKSWHPNVGEDNGMVCIDLGDEVRSVGCVVSALQHLLKHPNAEDGFGECAEEMWYRPEEYQKKARRMTIKHAMG